MWSRLNNIATFVCFIYIDPDLETHKEGGRQKRRNLLQSYYGNSADQGSEDQMDDVAADPYDIGNLLLLCNIERTNI